MSKNNHSKAQIIEQLSVAFLTWRRYLQRQLVPLQITLKQFHVLRKLAQKDFLYPSEIADMLFCDRPTATVIIRNMEKQGWVDRQKDEVDRRQIQMLITDAGHEKLIEVTQSANWKAAESEFDPLGNFEEAEINELYRLLARLNSHLKQTKS